MENLIQMRVAAAAHSKCDYTIKNGRKISFLKVTTSATSKQEFPGNANIVRKGYIQDEGLNAGNKTERQAVLFTFLLNPS